MRFNHLAFFRSGIQQMDRVKLTARCVTRWLGRFMPMITALHPILAVFAFWLVVCASPDFQHSRVGIGHSLKISFVRPSVFSVCPFTNCSRTDSICNVSRVHRAAVATRAQTT